MTGNQKKKAEAKTQKKRGTQTEKETEEEKEEEKGTGARPASAHLVSLRVAGINPLRSRSCARGGGVGTLGAEVRAGLARKTAGGQPPPPPVAERARVRVPQLAPVFAGEGHAAVAVDLAAQSTHLGQAWSGPSLTKIFVMIGTS
eukprot:gene936-biopygen29